MIMSTGHKMYINYVFVFRKVRSKGPAYSPAKSGYNAKQYEPLPRKKTQLIADNLTKQASVVIVQYLNGPRNECIFGYKVS